MLQYPDINPVALELGPLVIHWYGITYLFAFLAGWTLAKYRANKVGSGWIADEIGDAVFYIVLGVILGGKFGSLLFYQTDLLLSEPLKALNPFSDYGWRGMSFHGGFLGVLVAFWLYARNT
ncbi:MAG: phosphatidylglycerol:prolipoprotein diacylglycerol transferase, partial [Porticoccaceae bacterium]